MSAAQRDWVAAAADRAEQRLRGEIPSTFRHSNHSTGRDMAAQVQALIAAIINPQVTRRELRQLAQALKAGRAP